MCRFGVRSSRSTRIFHYNSLQRTSENKTLCNIRYFDAIISILMRYLISIFSIRYTTIWYDIRFKHILQRYSIRTRHFWSDNRSQIFWCNLRYPNSVINIWHWYLLFQSRGHSVSIFDILIRYSTPIFDIVMRYSTPIFDIFMRYSTPIFDTLIRYYTPIFDILTRYFDSIFSPFDIRFPLLINRKKNTWENEHQGTEDRIKPVIQLRTSKTIFFTISITSKHWNSGN